MSFKKLFWLATLTLLLSGMVSAEWKQEKKERGLSLLVFTYSNCDDKVICYNTFYEQYYGFWCTTKTKLVDKYCGLEKISKKRDPDKGCSQERPYRHEKYFDHPGCCRRTERFGKNDCVNDGCTAEHPIRTEANSPNSRHSCWDENFETYVYIQINNKLDERCSLDYPIASKINLVKGKKTCCKEDLSECTTLIDMNLSADGEYYEGTINSPAKAHKEEPQEPIRWTSPCLHNVSYDGINPDGSRWNSNNVWCDAGCAHPRCTKELPKPATNRRSQR